MSKNEILNASRKTIYRDMVNYPGFVKKVLRTADKYTVYLKALAYAYRSYFGIKYGCAATYIMDYLEENGYAVRSYHGHTGSKQDRRKKFVLVTDAGRIFAKPRKYCRKTR